MKTKIVIVSILLSLVFYGFSGEMKGVVSPGAELEKIQTDFVFTEGPASDAEGNVYFTDVRASTIYKWMYNDDSITIHREETNNANGLMFDASGNLIVCEMGGLKIVKDDLKGGVTVLTDNYDGMKYKGPNDLWVHPNGGIYFSDPYYGAGADQIEAGSMQVYYITPGTMEVIKVTDDLVKPNGLIGTPDGKYLYIADAGAGKTWKYKINKDGSLARKKIFCNQGSDGMSLDEMGNIYVTDQTSITVYNSKGNEIDKIVLPERPANMTFAGKDRKTLFITGFTSVYKIEMAVKGAATALNPEMK